MAEQAVQRAHVRWLVGALLNVMVNCWAAFAGVAVVVAIRNDSVGWLVASSLGFMAAFGCMALKGIWDNWK